MRDAMLNPADLCHPTPHRAPFSREGWHFELKHDGFRVLENSGPGTELPQRFPGRGLDSYLWSTCQCTSERGRLNKAWPTPDAPATLLGGAIFRLTLRTDFG